MSSINVTTTSIPTVYTESHFNPNIDLSKCSLQAKYLFGLSKKYTPPADFKHALPTLGRTEFAFVGRSNAGKSSLINRLLGSDKGLVRVSKQPGCTQNVNFFAFCKGKQNTVDDHAAYLVDLPGYGFSKKSQKLQDQWNEIIMGYFQIRDQTVLRYSEPCSARTNSNKVS